MFMQAIIQQRLTEIRQCEVATMESHSMQGQAICINTTETRANELIVDGLWIS